MEQRRLRVPAEPGLHEDHATVRVSHPVAGKQVRLFPAGVTFSTVFDWAGSLSEKPSKFKVFNLENQGEVHPYQPVVSGSFRVEEVEDMPFLSPSGEVAFKGFGVNNSDSSFSVNQGDLLESLRQREESKLHPEVLDFEITRGNTYSEMIKIYQQRRVLTHRIALRFKGESGVGDGITRDGYSAFFEELYTKMDGYDEKVFLNEDEDESEIIGKIINHAFIQYNIFPPLISKTTLKYHIFGEATDEDLLNSFLKFVSPNDAENINCLKKNKIQEKQPLYDIFFDYGIHAEPTATKIDSLCVKAAKEALIKNGYFTFKCIAKGMGSFWGKLSGDCLNYIFSFSTPTAERLIDLISPEEQSQKEGRLTGWFYRYIRNCNQCKLMTLLRFITGSTCLSLGSIKLQYVNQNPPHLRPISQTCFKILNLPRQYTCFTHLSHNLDIFLKADCESWQLQD